MVKDEQASEKNPSKVVNLFDEESDDESYHEGDLLEGFDEEDGSEDEEDSSDGDEDDDEAMDLETAATSSRVVATTASGDSRVRPIEVHTVNSDDDDGSGGENELNNEVFLMNEEYKVWKKHAMYLYDLVITHTLTWPSLTVEWIQAPPTRPTGKDYSIHRMVLGTNTSGTYDNYLIIFRAQLPNYDLQKVTDFSTTRVPNGYGAITAKLENFIKIPHEGDINKARVMPQNEFLIATKSSTGKVLLFDYSKHSSEPESRTSKAACRPQLTMEGHDTEGFGLSWNVREKGRLLSSDHNGVICIWDVNQTPVNQAIQPLNKIRDAHAGLVCDVQWHNFTDFTFASVGTDKALKIWDARRCDRGYSVLIPEAHSMDINSVSFSLHSEFIFLTGSQDKTATLWDMRNLKVRLHQFEGHSDEVYQVSWSPTHETMFATASADNRVFLWDLKGIYRTQSAEDAKEGPPELLFIHGGHTDKLCDFSWHPTEPFLMASVAENNSLHLWKAGDHVFQMLGNEEDRKSPTAMVADVVDD